jgi:hypothetical protein
MAWMWRAICNRCETRFDAAWGHTRRGFCLRCAECGRPLGVPKDEVEEPPGSNVQLSQLVAEVEATPKPPKRSLGELVEELVARGPSPEWIAWQQRVEATPPACACGGRYRFDAPSRCPQCRSADHRIDPSGGRCTRGEVAPNQPLQQAGHATDGSSSFGVAPAWASC